MAHKAENRSILICLNQTCRVLLFLPFEKVDGMMNCPSCEEPGGVAVDGNTRNLGQRYSPSYTG